MTSSLRTFIDGQIAARPLEATAIRKLYTVLKPVSLWDGEEESKITSQRDFLDAAFNLDEFIAYNKDDSWVRITMGEGCDMLTDYTTDLEEALKPFEAWLEKNEDRF